MEQEKDTTEKKDQPTNGTPTTVKFQWTLANKISIGLLVVSLGLAIVNGLTYWDIAKNYKIRNRPFVNIKPYKIIVEKELVRNIKTKELNTEFKIYFKSKNFGQFPAFIENIDIWITDASGDLTDLPLPPGDDPNNTNNFALFQDEKWLIDWTILFSNEDIKRIKGLKKTDYLVFKINYKILSNEKSLQKAFSYWIKTKHFLREDRQKEIEYRFRAIECGTDDISPDT
jgi:hypothetical protein